MMVSAYLISKQVDYSVYCAHCGTKNQDGLEGCDRCGELLERMDLAHVTNLGIKSCPGCKSVNAPRARFCNECGRNVDDVIATSGATQRPPPGRPAVPIGDSRTPQAPPPSDRPGAPGKPGNPNSASTPVSSEIRRPTAGPVSPSVATGRVGSSRGAEDLRADTDNPTVAPNDSGTPEAELPQSIKGWNWGALFLPFIWGPFNRVWLGLAVPIVLFLPIHWTLGLLIYGPFAMFVGMRGNELAWRARKWKSVEHFKLVQGLWAKWGIIGFTAFTISILFAVSSGAD